MMKLHSGRKVVLLSAMLLVLTGVTGCQSFLPPAVTGPIKVALGQMNTLTPAEVIAVQELGAPDLDLTDEQAEMISDVLEQADLRTLEEVQALADEIADAADDPDELEQIAEDNNITEDQIEEFMELFGDIDPEEFAAALE